MAKRKRIGLIYSYDEQWIAGSYYIQNLIFGLKTLDAESQPELIIFSEDKKNYEELIRHTNYPYIKFYLIRYPKNLLVKILNKISNILFKRPFFDFRPHKDSVDVLFPANQDDFFELISNKLFWIPDFQEKHFPDFFDKDSLEKIERQKKEIISNNAPLLLSSFSVLEDLETFYSGYQCKPYVLPFAVTHPNFEDISVEELKIKFGIDHPYFFAPNQLWKHKNHLTILKAVSLLKDQGIEILVVFSGKESDFRNPEHPQSLKDFVKEHQLELNCRFLGFIDRREQLKLMQNSIAVIQASLFEGWSTVVEDAKALNKYLILSNLKVHKEQVQDSVRFFDPLDVENLSTILKGMNAEYPIVNHIDYQQNIRQFGSGFMKIINDIHH